ncbi:MAG: hypothetical protein ABIQ70_13555 [Dokdonella sp.]
MTIRKPSTATHSALTLALLASLLMASSSTVAQTCNAPAAWPADRQLFSGTTCGGEHVAESICNSVHGNPGPNFLVRIYLNHTATAITLTAAAPDSIRRCTLPTALTAAVPQLALPLVIRPRPSTSPAFHQANTGCSSPPPSRTKRVPVDRLY